MSIKTTIFKWLLPSSLITWLKNKKRLLGVISLLLWICIYAVPVVYPEGNYLTPIAIRIRDFLASLGLDMNSFLFDAGTGLTVIGIVDWATKHWTTDKLVQGAGAVERLVSFGSFSKTSDKTGA
jgi:hypothetical protein